MQVYFTLVSKTFRCPPEKQLTLLYFDRVYDKIELVLRFIIVVQLYLIDL